MSGAGIRGFDVELRTAEESPRSTITEDEVLIDHMSKVGSDISRRELLSRAGGLAAAAMVPGLLPTRASAQPTSSLQDAFPRKVDFTIPEGVDARVASNYVRFSPSVYNDLADVDRALEALS